MHEMDILFRRNISLWIKMENVFCIKFYLTPREKQKRKKIHI